jgi:hypothetical protein
VDEGITDVDEATSEDARSDGSDGEPGWFGVRCIFRWSQPPTYEERITLWRAESLDDAIARAEADAAAYAARLGSEYLDIAQAYWIGPEQPVHGSEVFSLMRDSELEPDDYLDSFYDTGQERQRTET